MNPPSTATKAYASALIAVCAAVGGTFADSTIGKVAIILGAAVTAWLGTYKAKNTETAHTGAEESVTREVVSTTGEVIGDVVTTTGAAAGGIIKGTTGGLGKLIDKTVGAVLPGTKAAA